MISWRRSAPCRPSRVRHRQDGVGRLHVHSTTGARHRRVCRNGGEAVRRCAGVHVKTQNTRRYWTPSAGRPGDACAVRVGPAGARRPALGGRPTKTAPRAALAAWRARKALRPSTGPSGGRRGLGRRRRCPVRATPPSSARPDEVPERAGTAHCRADGALGGPTKLGFTCDSTYYTTVTELNTGGVTVVGLRPHTTLLVTRWPRRPGKYK